MFDKQGEDNANLIIWLNIDPDKVKQRINKITARLEKALSQAQLRKVSNSFNQEKN